VPSIIRIEREWLGFGYQLGFSVVDDDQAASSCLQLLNHLFVADACRMDVEGCAGLHDLPRSVV
jgi:hypothetical protein